MDTRLHQNQRSRCGISKHGLAGIAAAFVAATALPAQALTITPYFSSSITGDPNAALIEGTINNAIQFYNNSFSNPINVDIVFQQVTDASIYGIGFNESTNYQPSYTSYTAALASQSLLHPENAVLATAVTSLSNGNEADTAYATSAAMRAIGFGSSVGTYGVDGVLGHGTVDGVVTLNTFFPIAYSGTPGATQYDGFTTIQHEIDEVLGIGDQGSVSSYPGYSGNLDHHLRGESAWVNGQSTVGPLDLYRWAEWDPFFPLQPAMYNLAGRAYFSIDSGVTSIMPFDVHSGDWNLSAGCNTVQGYACPGQLQGHLSLSSPEVIALQAIGYNLAAPVPEPQSYALMLAGIGLVGSWARRRKSA